MTTPGRYGAWARHVTPTAGKLGDKTYGEVRTYATLVIDVPAATSSAYAPLPQAAASFGAVACDGWLYVYGGHVVPTHNYSTASVSGQFHRLNLKDHATWQTLPGGPALQGMNLAAWNGKIYRVGGMNPRNQPGEPADVRSIADCASFDPATNQWTSLPPLPAPRSSYDMVVIDGKLYVVGGWTLTGDPRKAQFVETSLILDLASDNPQWKSIKQPFDRRALIAAAYQGKVYAIGGFDPDADPSLKVNIYDPHAKAWSKGPDLPGPDRNGFGPAACTLDGHLFVSVADGSLYRLNEAGDGWDKVATTTPRIVHRLAANGSEVLVIGGASGKRQQNLIEAVSVEPSPAQAGNGARGQNLQ
jgi:N-acetylneuraminic acid mutarotase